MKKLIAIILSVLMIAVFSSCGTKPETQIANPWKSFETLNHAEEYIGFELGMPETICDTYQAVSFQVLDVDSPLLEVTYQDEDLEVIVRKSNDIDQDISGVYGFEQTETIERDGVTIKIFKPSEPAETPDAILCTFDHDGSAWSLYAPNGYWGDSCEDFYSAIFKE